MMVSLQVLLHERDNEHPNMLKLVVMLAGFILIALIRLVDTHSHEGGGHSHDHEHEVTTLNSTVLAN